VIRRDHHCPWTGCCIGRDNHLSFVGYLLIEVVVMLLIVPDTAHRLFAPVPPGAWLRANGPALVIFVLCSFDLMFITLLSGVHTWLAVRNETTWESTSREKISYLARFRKGYRPFNRGWCANVIEFCTMARRQTVWDISNPDLAALVLETQTKISALKLNPGLFKQEQAGV
jgi:palmitoyltransferase